MAYRVVRDYYRREHYDFYRACASPFWSVTFELDVTRLRAALRARGWRTYLNLCYFLTRACQPLEDFRYRLVEGEIVLHDTLHPGLAVPAPGGLFAFEHHDFREDPAEFNRAAEAREPATGLATWQGEARAWLYFSALPKIRFTGLTHASLSAVDDQPRVSFGRFAERAGRATVPVGVQVNHLFLDGAAVGDLAERAQAEFDAAG